MDLTYRRKVMSQQTVCSFSRRHRRRKDMFLRNKSKINKTSSGDKESCCLDVRECVGVTSDDNPSSWDTMSDADQLQEEHTPQNTELSSSIANCDVLSTLEGRGSAQNIPTELPLLCNIAQKVFREANGTVEVVVFDMDVAKDSLGTHDGGGEETRIDTKSKDTISLNIKSRHKSSSKSNAEVCCNQVTKCNAVPVLGGDVLRTDICLLPDKRNSTDIINSTTGDNDHVHYTLRIIKSKSYENLIQGSDILRECHTAVPYDSVMKKKICLDKIFQIEKKDYPKTFSDVKQEQIGDLPAFKDSKMTHKRRSSACSILQKYIYLEEPLTPLAQKERNQRHQTIECHILSTGSMKKNKSSLPSLAGSDHIANSNRCSQEKSSIRKGGAPKRQGFKTKEEKQYKSNEQTRIKEAVQQDVSPSHQTGPLVLQRQLQLGLAAEGAAEISHRERDTEDRPCFLEQMQCYDRSQKFPFSTDNISVVHVDENLLPKNIYEVSTKSVSSCKDNGFRSKTLMNTIVSKHSKLKRDLSSHQIESHQRDHGTISKLFEIAGDSMKLQLTSDESTPLKRSLFFGSTQEVVRAMGIIQRELHNARENLVQSEISFKNMLSQYVCHLASDLQLLRVVEVVSRRQVECEQSIRSMSHKLIKEQMRALCSLKESSEEHVLSLARQNKVLEEENVLMRQKFEKAVSKSKNVENTEDITTKNIDSLRMKLAKAQNNLSELEGAYLKLLHCLEQYSEEIHSLHLEAENQRILHSRYEADFNVEKEYLSGKLDESHKIIKEVSHLADTLISDLRSIQNRLGCAKTRINWERLKGNGCSISVVLDVCHSCIQEIGLEIFNLHQELHEKNKDLDNEKANCQKLQQVLFELDNEYNKLRQQSETVINEKINVEKQLIKSIQETDSLKKQLSTYSINTSALESEVEELNKIKTEVKEQGILKSQLEKNIQELLSEKNIISQKLFQEKETGQSMELDLVKMTATVDLYEASNKDLLRTNNTLKDKLRESEILIQHLENFSKDHDELKSNYHKELAEKECLHQEICSLKSDLTTLKNFRESLEKEIEKLNGDLKTISKENFGNKWEIKNLKDVNKCLERDNCNMLRRLENETSQYNIQITELQLNSKKLDDVIQEQDKELEELKKVLTVQSETICAQQKECDEKRDIINKMEEKCEELKSKQKADEVQILTLKNRIQELEKEINKINHCNTTTVESIRYEFDSLETTLKITQDDLNNTILKMQEREASLKLAQDSLQKAESIIQQKQHQMNEMQKRIEFFEKNEDECKKLKSANTQMQNLFQEHDNLVKNWNKLKDYETSLQLENESLHQNLKVFQNRYETLNHYYVTQKEQMKKLKFQLFTLQDNLNKIEINNKSLLADIQNTPYEGFSNKIDATNISCEVNDVTIEEKQDVIEEKTARLQSQVKLLHELHKRNTNDLIYTKKTIQIQEEKIHELSGYLESEISKSRVLEQEHKNMEQKQIKLLEEIEELRSLMNKESQNCISLTEEYNSHEKEHSDRETELLRKIENLKEDLKNCKEDLKAANDKRYQIEESLEEKESDILALTQKNQELESRFSDYGRTLTHLADEKRRAEQLSAQLQVAHAEAAGLRALQALARQQNDSLQEALHDARGEAERARAAGDTLQRRAVELEAQLQQAQATLTKYSENAADLSEELESLRKRKEQVEQSHEDLLKEKENLDSRTQKLSQKLLRAVKEVYDTRMEFKLAHEKMIELSNHINSLQEQKAQKCNEVSSLSAEIAQLNLQAAQRSDTSSRSDSGEESRRQEMTHLRAQIDDLHDQLTRRKRKCQSEAKKMEELLMIKDDNIAQCGEKIRTLQEQNIRANIRLSEAQSQLLTQRQEQRALECQLMKLQGEKRDLALQLKLAESHLEEERQQRTSLEEENRRLLGRIHEVKIV